MFPRALYTSCIHLKNLNNKVFVSNTFLESPILKSACGLVVTTADKCILIFYKGPKIYFAKVN